MKLRFATSLALDQLSALYPNTDAPFEDDMDVVNRLLPYHIYQQPQEDLQAVVGENSQKGKGKATDSNLAEEIEGTYERIYLPVHTIPIIAAETRFVLECFKRRQTLEDRFRRARLKPGTVSRNN